MAQKRDMKRFIPFLFTLFVMPAIADTQMLTDALRATYTACIGIDEELTDLKKMAGLNTAITAVGTATGAGATVVGVVKTAKDKKAETLEAILKEIEEKSKNHQGMTDTEISVFMSEFNSAYQTILTSEDEIESELDKTIKQSKSLGNWRTGLMAGSTATNVAGAIIAGTNKVDEDLETQIKACVKSVNNLRSAIMQARMDGTDISEAQSIATTCGEFEYADLSKINKRAQSATISAGIGAATGLAGTITSASANSDATRDDNTESGKKREKNLNTASNILAGTTTVAGATATAFNATQIKAIKQVAQIAANCTEVLK